VKSLLTVVVLVILGSVFRKGGTSPLQLWAGLQIRLQNGAAKPNQLISVYVCFTVTENS